VGTRHGEMDVNYCNSAAFTLVLGCADELRLLEVCSNVVTERTSSAAHEAAGGSLLGVAQWLAERTIDS
jgi:hypothetical protein